MFLDHQWHAHAGNLHSTRGSGDSCRVVPCSWQKNIWTFTVNMNVLRPQTLPGKTDLSKSRSGRLGIGCARCKNCWNCCCCCAVGWAIATACGGSLRSGLVFPALDGVATTGAGEEWTIGWPKLLSSFVGVWYLHQKQYFPLSPYQAAIIYVFCLNLICIALISYNSLPFQFCKSQRVYFLSLDSRESKQTLLDQLKNEKLSK